MGRQPPLTGNPFGRQVYLYLHRSRQLRTLGTGTQLFITESFHRDKAQAEAHDQFREAYWKKRARDYIGSCKKLILKGLIMKELLSIEKNLNILFPQSYKNTLDKFKLFMEIEFKDYEIDLFNNNLLFDELNSFPRWNYMEYLVEINKKKQKAENIVQRHDSTEFVDSERVKKGFMFGTSSDGGRLYFNLNENLSIWEYWLDDGSVGKVADTFDEILEYGKIIDFE